MNGVINLLKAIYHRNKLFFVIAIVAIFVFVVGCAAQGSTPPPPPSGPIGGGCG